MTLRLVSLLAASGWLLVLLATPALAEHKYVGVKNCAICHKKELIGDQYDVWKKSKHAKAFETLKTPAAVAAAKEKGITTPPHETEACLKCHATAANVTKAMTASKPLDLSDGVQCESCHGPGSDYRKNKVMADPAAAVKAGLVMPDEKTCTGCHNDQSPSFKGFDYAAYVKMIAHPIPAEVKGRYLEAVKEARKKGK